MTDIARLSAALSRSYTIERELGGGGMSRVFLATETALNRSVVIKAIAILERRVADLPPSLPSETHALLAYAYARAGRAERARETIAALQRAGGGRLPPIGTIAAALDLLGERDAAVGVLADAFADHDLWLGIFNHTERYDGLRKEPRGAAMFAKAEAW